MHLGIRSKLFIAFLVTAIIVVISMMLFTRWSIKQGFVEYVENRQTIRIERISEQLISLYVVDNNWNELRHNPRQWLSILFERQFQRLERDRRDGGANFRERRRPPRIPYRRFLHSNSREWPPDRALERINNTERPAPIETRIMLFDRGDMPIFGRADLFDNSQHYPLRYNEQKIGTLAVISAPSVLETGEVQFIRKQFTELIWIAIAVVLLSALIAMIVARRLVKPVENFRHASHQLAKGNYSTRVPTDRQDEIGLLARDINSLAESLEAHDNSRRQWVADIAHELRTPLSVLRGELEALQSGVRPLQSTAIDSLHEDTLRLGRLIDDLYQLSMTDLGALSYHKQDCYPLEILEEEIENFSDNFNRLQIHIENHCQDMPDIKLYADPQRLAQLFGNLLKNTLRYTNAGGTLKIEANISDKALTINFQDTEPGVDNKDLPRLFERLYRVEASRNRATGGAGLGLAIASNIIKAHDGNISAHDSPLGGLWIQIKLPIYEST